MVLGLFGSVVKFFVKAVEHAIVCNYVTSDVVGPEFFWHVGVVHGGSCRGSYCPLDSLHVRVVHRGVYGGSRNLNSEFGEFANDGLCYE